MRTKCTIWPKQGRALQMCSGFQQYVNNGLRGRNPCTGQNLGFHPEGLRQSCRRRAAVALTALSSFKSLQMRLKQYSANRNPHFSCTSGHYYRMLRLHGSLPHLCPAHRCFLESHFLCIAVRQHLILCEAAVSERWSNAAARELQDRS